MLKNLPKSLSETYERILLKIVGKGEATAAKAEKILTWLVGSCRPLRLSQLEEALMIEPGSRELNESLRPMSVKEILTTCGSLVEEYNWWGGRSVRLSHYIVQVKPKLPLLVNTLSK